MKDWLLSFLVIHQFIVAANLVAQGTPAAIFTSPMPTNSAHFGRAMATVGTDKVLIVSESYSGGAPYRGVAYLFQLDGTLLTTITNPRPDSAFVKLFAAAVAAIGTDRLLITDRGQGVVYLYNTDGTLLTTITNPTSGSVSMGFGIPIIPIGTDQLLIGDTEYNENGLDFTGIAYLYDTNGNRLTTFTNPAPADWSFFGAGIAAIGTNMVLIGATGDDTGAPDAGVAYLYTTGGDRLVTLANPAPETGEQFGAPAVALGTDKVLIAAIRDHTGAQSAGAAYLFSTNGTLLNTFTNPTPSSSEYFGRALAAIPPDKLLIGAYGDDMVAQLSGSAYLYHTNGSLLATITNPTPAASDWFGLTVAAVGTDKILIAAHGDDTFGTNAGAVYRYDLNTILPRPRLRILLTASNTVVLTWPAPPTEWKFQSNPDPTTTNWSDVTNAVNLVGGEKQVIITPASGSRYFRLLQP